MLTGLLCSSFPAAKASLRQSTPNLTFRKMPLTRSHSTSTSHPIHGVRHSMDFPRYLHISYIFAIVLHLSSHRHRRLFHFLPSCLEGSNFLTLLTNRPQTRHCSEHLSSSTFITAQRIDCSAVWGACQTPRGVEVEECDNIYIQRDSSGT